MDALVLGQGAGAVAETAAGYGVRKVLLGEGAAFAAYLARWVLRFSMGSEAMQRISNAIKEGAEAFLRRQNRTILTLAIVFAAVYRLVDVAALLQAPATIDVVAITAKNMERAFT